MIPDFTRPEELNRLLICLVDGGGDLSKDSLITALSSSVFYALLPDHASTVTAALAGGLISQADDRLLITELGNRFLALNSESLYELSPGQARFIFINLIQREPFLAVARSLFLMFRPRGMGVSLSLDLYLVNISDDQSKLLSLLRRLGVISISKGIATISKEYIPYASSTRARRVMTIDELERLLEERKARGNAAELLVLEAERERLRALGHPIEAAAVNLVSMFDVGAGYDIESFDGDSDSLTPDRFIEVKSTVSEAGVFFWSANERATAEELGDKYWICHLRGFSIGNQKGYSLVWIRNPAAKVDTGDLMINCSQFEVTFELDKMAKPT